MLEKLQLRIAAGKAEATRGTPVPRPSWLLQRSHGHHDSLAAPPGGFRDFENAEAWGARRGSKGKYVIATSELGLSVLEVVAIYKDLERRRKGVSSAQGRVGDAADISSDRGASEGTYLCGHPVLLV